MFKTLLEAVQSHDFGEADQYGASDVFSLFCTQNGLSEAASYSLESVMNYFRFYEMDSYWTDLVTDGAKAIKLDLDTLEFNKPLGPFKSSFYVRDKDLHVFLLEEDCFRFNNFDLKDKGLLFKRLVGSVPGDHKIDIINQRHLAGGKVTRNRELHRTIRLRTK